MKRKAEVVFGLATGLLGLAYTLSLYRRIQEPGDPAYANIGFFGSEFSVIVALFLIPSLLVAFGSYFHGVQGRRWGRTILTVGAVILTALFFLLAVRLLQNFWLALLWLTPLATLLTAYFPRRNSSLR